MSRGMFGWSLPPGVSSRMIDEAYGVEVPCEVCGQWDCICPECPVCEEVGNPVCYDGGTKCSWCGTRAAGVPCYQCEQEGGAGREKPALRAHGLVRSLAQVARRAELDRRIAEEAEAEARYGDGWDRREREGGE